jgi:hypothetical protein
MGREINEDRIRELEKKIEEGTGDMIQLKRARNSLLNVSTRVPLEILGYIFCWRAFPNSDHFCPSEPQKGSYKFLLVCHHWLEVAFHTPELWSYWGNTLGQWLRRSKRAGTPSVTDLVLIGLQLGHDLVPLHGTLRNALRERAERNTIRSIHLSTLKSSLQTSIFSALTPDGEDIRYTSVEAVSLRHVKVSNFFARHRFPKLRYLHLSVGVRIPSWKDLGSNITTLTTLFIIVDHETGVPTTTQLLSILASNPRLRDLTLSSLMMMGGMPTISASLCQLTRFSVGGYLHPVSQLLQQLDYPGSMAEMTLSVSHDVVEDLVGFLGPYLQDYILRDGRFSEGLGIFVDSLPASVSIQASTDNNVNSQRETFASFTANFRANRPPRNRVRFCSNFFAHTPVDYVVYFGGELSMDEIRRIAPTMPQVQELHLVGARLADRFLRSDSGGPLDEEKLFPSLQRLHLEDANFGGDESWGALLSYLVHQTSGGQRISLAISGLPRHICKDVVAAVESLVEELVFDFSLDNDCPRCLSAQDY